jgi:hypothetical protein
MNETENSHEPLIERALAGFDLAAEYHLANCAPCQTERERMEAALREFGAANREYAGRTEAFWEQQAGRIRMARNHRTQKSSLALTLVPGLAVLLLLAFALVNRGALNEGPRAHSAPTTAQTDSDQELLVEIERVVQSQTPHSLEPAALMVERDDSDGPRSSTNSIKEPRSREN